MLTDITDLDQLPEADGIIVLSTPKTGTSLFSHYLNCGVWEWAHPGVPEPTHRNAWTTTPFPCFMDPTFDPLLRGLMPQNGPHPALIVHLTLYSPRTLMQLIESWSHRNPLVMLLTRSDTYKQAISMQLSGGLQCWRILNPEYAPWVQPYLENHPQEFRSPDHFAEAAASYVMDKPEIIEEAHRISGNLNRLNEQARELLESWKGQAYHVQDLPNLIPKDWVHPTLPFPPHPSILERL